MFMGLLTWTRLNTYCANTRPTRSGICKFFSYKHSKAVISSSIVFRIFFSQIILLIRAIGQTSGVQLSATVSNRQQKMHLQIPLVSILGINLLKFPCLIHAIYRHSLLINWFTIPSPRRKAVTEGVKFLAKAYTIFELGLLQCWVYYTTEVKIWFHYLFILLNLIYLFLYLSSKMKEYDKNNKQ